MRENTTNASLENTSDLIGFVDNLPNDISSNDTNVFVEKTDEIVLQQPNTGGKNDVLKDPTGGGRKGVLVSAIRTQYNIHIRNPHLGKRRYPYPQ